LIQSKVGGYLTVYKDTNQYGVYLDKKIKEDMDSQLFKIELKVGSKGCQIETINHKAIGILNL